ncbi:MAG: DUF1592 domain-containing protein [Rubripirellula sp.]
MQRNGLLFLACFFAAHWSVGLVVLQAEETGSKVSMELEAVYRDQLMPLLRTYCWDCHGEDEEVVLTGVKSVADLRQNRELWVRALSQIRNGTMPPSDGPELKPELRVQFADLLSEVATSVDCVQDPNAGKVAMRRLNRFEYRNTIRDLTGVDYQTAMRFPGDDVGYGFDNIGDVLSLPPLLMEKYLDAAIAITGEAIYTPPAPLLYEVEKQAGQLEGASRFARGSTAALASRGTVSLKVDLPFAGRFKLTVRARGDQAGDEPVKVEVLSGREKRILEVPSSDPQEYSTWLRLGSGERQIDLSFINDYYVAGKADRNLYLFSVKLEGQKDEAGVSIAPDLPPSHRRLIFVMPDESTTPDQAASLILSRFASRAFRRPATNSETTRLVQLAAKVRKDGGSFEAAIQVAMQAVLISPHFLFKVERSHSEQEKKSKTLNQYELATRISYFLWSSMPDDELLLMAHQGVLTDEKRLLEKVGRMIQDPRSNQFVEHFAGQWLQLRNLDTVEPDFDEFKQDDVEIRDLMRRETMTFFAGVMRANLPVLELLNAEFTYLNESLAAYYGIEGVRGDQFRKVSLVGTPRGGLLTHGSVLTVTSNPTRTSPVKRGKWILDNLLNTPPPPAPPNVPELEKGKLTGTLREQMEQHRENPACAACHQMMDPLGFALENFDAVGRWREREGGQPVDASGELPDGTQFRGVVELRNLLSGKRGNDFIRCLAEKMLIYATGRGTEYYDQCALDELVEFVTKNESRFAYLIAGVILSDPFQKQGHRE